MGGHAAHFRRAPPPFAPPPLIAALCEFRMHVRSTEIVKFCMGGRFFSVTEP